MVIIVHKTDGVFIGSFLGLAFFSKLDDVGQDCAVCFENETAAKEYLKTWEPAADVASYSFPDVPEADGCNYVKKELVVEYW